MIIEKNIKNIYIDEKKSKRYERKIKKISQNNKKIKKLRKIKKISVKKLKTVKINQYAGIRLADMIAGLSRLYFDKKIVDISCKNL